MSKFLDQEDMPKADPWVGGHKRPSLPKVPDGWSSPKAGMWAKQGYSVVECPVEVPKGGVLWRAFPPGISRHVASFTILAHARAWVERRLAERNGGAAVRARGARRLDKRSKT